AVENSLFRHRREVLRINLDGFLSRCRTEWSAGFVRGCADVGGVSGHVYQARYLRVVTNFADDSTAPGVPYENDRTVLHGDDSTCRIGIVRQRRERILNGDSVKAAFFKDWNDLGPTAAVREGSVNENDILDGRLLRLSICSAGEGGGGCDASCENSFGDFHFH